jgi:hypothetical protein
MTDTSTHLTVQALTRELLIIDEVATRASKAEQLSDLVDLYVQLDDFKKQFKIVLDDIANKAINLMGNVPEVTASNGMVVEQKSGAPRKAWDHQNIADLVARRIVANSIDMDTGEVLLSNTDQIKALLNYAGVGYWKVKALADLNINADNFCEVGEPSTTLAIRKAK